MIVEQVVVVAAGELPDAALPDPAEVGLLHVDTAGELVVVHHAAAAAGLAAGEADGGRLTWAEVPILDGSFTWTRTVFSQVKTIVVKIRKENFTTC